MGDSSKSIVTALVAAGAQWKVRSIGPAEGQEHTHTIILLHGRDSNCDEFAGEFFESEISEHLAGDIALEGTAPHARTFQGLFPTFKWVFPSALSVLSERFGLEMSQWFDMWSVENPSERPELQSIGLCRSIEFVSDLLSNESHFVRRGNIYLGGISQGFVTAVAAFLADNQGLAGLIGFSSWAYPELAPYGTQSLSKGRLLGSEFWAGRGSGPGPTEGTRTTPVFLGHAADDEIVPVQNGRILRDALHNVAESNVEWHEYQSGGHWITEPEGVDDLVRFLRRTMESASL
ncbi:hypothetical protein EsH8_I_000053 [Colletotrichum jinshuiense]